METKAQKQLIKKIEELKKIDSLYPDKKRKARIAELEIKYNLLTPYHARDEIIRRTN